MKCSKFQILGSVVGNQYFIKTNYKRKEIRGTLLYFCSQVLVLQIERRFRRLKDFSLSIYVKYFRWMMCSI